MGNAKNIPRDTLMLPYQRAWVKDAARLKLAEKARQIGWTWASGYGLVRRKAQHSAQLDAWVSSRDDIQARLFLEDCKHFSALMHCGARDLGQRVIDRHGHSAYVLALANKLRIHSMSSNPDAQAGKRGDRILDEFALHPDPRKLYSIAYPGITWGGSLEIFSTHRGSHNYFNDLINEIRHKRNPKKFSLHRVTLQDALDQGFLFKLQEKLPADDPRQEMDEAEYFDFIRSGCPDDESFLQEYMCVPGDDSAAFLSYDLIASCEYPPGEAWETPLAQARGRLYVGVDVGRDHDLTVIWVVERLADVDYTRKVVSLKNTPFEAQERELCAILDLAQVRRCCIDCTGLGRQFTERAQKRYGAYRIEAVNFTGPVKEDLAYPVKKQRRHPRGSSRHQKRDDRRRQHPVHCRPREERPRRSLLGAGARQTRGPVALGRAEPRHRRRLWRVSGRRLVSRTKSKLLSVGQPRGPRARARYLCPSRADNNRRPAHPNLQSSPPPNLTRLCL